MPFTLAHPAAVLPLIRRPLIASALVAGAVAPDLLYLDPIYHLATQQIHGNLTLTLTHKFSSAFWLDPAIALILLAAFHLVVRRPLAALAPPSLASRFPAPPRPTPTVLVWTVISAILGAFTHVLWDSFTHGDGYFVRRFPDFFRAEVTATWDVNRILQYVSTVVGCVILAIWLCRWYRRTSPVNPTNQVPPWVRYVVLAGVLALGVAGASVQLSGADDLAGETAVRLVLTGLVFGGLAAVGWYVAVWHLVRWRRRDATDGAV
ncbi:DUF4184 family protein [Kribbella sp. NPDC049174]|uniref:DUF4184 family protein n=1 Tax=Kribbella sp. NPDC049174 TaxID=3364112 RepID=UPI003722FDB5